MHKFGLHVKFIKSSIFKYISTKLSNKRVGRRNLAFPTCNRNYLKKEKIEDHAYFMKSELLSYIPLPT